MENHAQFIVVHKHTSHASITANESGCRVCPRMNHIPIEYKVRPSLQCRFLQRLCHHALLNCRHIIWSVAAAAFLPPSLHTRRPCSRHRHFPIRLYARLHLRRISFTPAQMFVFGPIPLPTITIITTLIHIFHPAKMHDKPHQAPAFTIAVKTLTYRITFTSMLATQSTRTGIRIRRHDVRLQSAITIRYRTRF